MKTKGNDQKGNTVVAESRPGLKFSAAPFSGLHYFPKQFLGEVGKSKYRDPRARRIWEK